MISNISSTPDETETTRNPTQLSELATNKLIPQLTPRHCSWVSDVINISNYLKAYALPKNIFIAPEKETFRQLKPANNCMTVFDVASARVINGASCTDVAQKHGILATGRAFRELQMRADAANNKRQPDSQPA